MLTGLDANKRHGIGVVKVVAQVGDPKGISHYSLIARNLQPTVETGLGILKAFNSVVLLNVHR